MSEENKENPFKDYGAALEKFGKILQNDKATFQEVSDAASEAGFVVSIGLQQQPQKGN